MSKTASKELELFGSKSEIPAHLQAMGGSDADTGNENVGQDDVALPRLKLLQALSAEVSEGEGAQGQYYNSITGDTNPWLYVVNLHYLKEYAVFKDRKLGTEFQGTFNASEAAQAHIESLDRPDDYAITETGRHVLLLLNEEGEAQYPIIFNMANTNMQVSRMWNSNILAKGKNLPRYASIWKLGTKKMSNTRGTWFVSDPEWAGWANEKLFAEIEQYYEQVKDTAV